MVDGKYGAIAKHLNAKIANSSFTFFAIQDMTINHGDEILQVPLKKDFPFVKLKKKLNTLTGLAIHPNLSKYTNFEITPNNCYLASC